MNNTVICLMGPTAAGKTDLVFELAKKFPVEIISVDSGMIYRGMDIGTAKPTAEQLKIVPHRLIDICDPNENYSAGNFREDVLVEIKDILSKNKVPLLVGGTMFYFRVLEYGISNLPKSCPAIRLKLNQQLQEYGIGYLYEQLKIIDPITADILKPADKQRIQRALEIFLITGKTLTQLKQEFIPQKTQYKFINFAMMPLERSALHARIEQRLKNMLSNGFIEEVQTLYNRGDLNPDLPSMRTVGYRQAWKLLTSEIDYEQMVNEIKIATQQLAKRQITWLKSWPDIKWLEYEHPLGTIDFHSSF